MHPLAVPAVGNACARHQSGRQQVGQRNILERPAHRSVENLPTRARGAQRLQLAMSRTAFDALRERDRPIDGADNVGDADLLRRASQLVAALGPAHCGENAGARERGQQLARGRQRNCRRPSDRLGAVRHRLRARDVSHQHHTVIGKTAQAYHLLRPIPDKFGLVFMWDKVRFKSTDLRRCCRATSSRRC